MLVLINRLPWNIKNICIEQFSRNFKGYHSVKEYRKQNVDATYFSTELLDSFKILCNEVVAWVKRVVLYD